MRKVAAVLLALCATVLDVPAQERARATVVLVTGAAGEAAFGAAFDAWAERWRAASERAGAELVRIGAANADTQDDRTALRDALRAAANEPDAPLWLVYLGHGTYDGEDAAWNLTGPDVRATELANWLEPVTRPTAVLVCAASSGPFVNRLSRPGRVVVTATRSGHETSFARFGDALSEAIGGLAADLDGDGQTSLLEAFLFASDATAAFYESAQRLATEHALLDDDGNGRGTGADWYEGLRPVQRASGDETPDGLLAHRFVLLPSEEERSLPVGVRARRDALERELAQLRQRKAATPRDAYERELERILVALARLYGSL